MRLIKYMSLFIFITVISWAQEKPDFITQPLQCSTCHTCEVPTKNNPCLRECVREHLITVRNSSEKAPASIIIDRFPKADDLYEPAVFSHNLHAEMSNLSGGCETCHHYNPPGRILTCIECHETERLRTDISKPDLKAAYHRQCIDCHRGWSHEIDCESCHALKGAKTDESTAKPVSVHPKIKTPTKLVIETDYDDGKIVTFHHSEHVDIYSLECQSCHSQESCIKCHDVKVSHEEYKSMAEPHANCEKCHDTEDNCSFCHDTKEKAGFDHLKRTGWKLEGAHGNLSCKSCHKTKGKFTGLNSNCKTCHTDWTTENFDHRKVGLELDEIHIENDCSDCHIETTYSNPTCSNCHDEDITYPDYVPGELNK